MAARDEIALQRDALARTSERLQSELAELTSTRGAALVMRRAVQERSSRRSPVVGPIAMAILVLLAVVVVLLVTRAL